MPNHLRPSPVKSVEDIAAEWNAVSEKRDEEIASGLDISYNHVLMPAVESFKSEWAGSSVLDIGCGSGHLSSRLAAKRAQVVGIDISGKSVELAKSAATAPNLRFVHMSVEEYAARSERLAFDVVVANMVLQSAPNLRPFLKAARALARKEFLLTIPHPCYWPRYWDYEAEEWYVYGEELAIEAPFRTTRNPTGAGCITYIHRPLSMYLNALAEVGFRLTAIQELMPTSQVMRMYPEPWKYPRFVAIALTAD